MGTNPLLLDILKARYFKNSSVLESSRGYDSSFTWRSIWGAKSLLLEGLGWPIGNGVNVRVWHDKWVPRGSQLIVPSTTDVSLSDMKVSELIKFDDATWDIDALSRCFDAATVSDILTIPRSNRWPRDGMYWPLNKNGVYSVESGYWLGRFGHDDIMLNPEAATASKLWRLVWNLNGPPKLRHFLWRLCNDTLAMKSVLYNRYCAPSPLCDRCNEEGETLIHCLVECLASRQMWEKHTAFSTVCAAPRSSIHDFIFWIHGHSSSDEFLSIASVLWAAWFVRNKQVFERVTCDPLKIATEFSNLVHDYVSYSVMVHQPNDILQFTSWRPPNRGWIKINFDANVIAGVSRGLGVVFRDDQGKLLLAGVRRIHTNWSVEVCEAEAVLFGVELAVRFGYTHIQLEGDSRNVVSAIESGMEGLSPIHLVYDRISELCSYFHGFGCSFVKRSGNTLAHLVARWDTGVASEKLCMDPFPQGLITLAELDLS